MKPLGASDPAVVASYRLIAVLGGGGMGRVYLGESRSGRRVAIKVIRAELAQDPVFRRRFAREVKAAKKVSPLFTAAVVDADANAELPWFATTYIAGPTLTQLVLTGGPLSPRAVLTLAAGLSDAVTSIHRVGLVHRDIKPSNVIINDDGPHIIDFGIALTEESTSRLTTSLVVGTPSYIAPEIIYGEESSPASDIFSLGATLVFAASGKHLVADGSMYAQILQITRGGFDLQSVPRELRPLIVRCISPAPKDRPTADELAHILLASGVSAPSPGWYTTKEPAVELTVPPVPPERASPRRGVSRRRVLAFGGLLGAGTVGAGVGIMAGRFRDPPLDASARWGAPTVGASTPRQIVPGTVVWTARSGATPVGQSPSNHQTGVRVIAGPGKRIIASNASDIFAVDADGHPLWNQPLTTGAVNLLPWGDAVLVTDAKRLWVLDAASGAQRFSKNLVDEEEKLSRDSNPDNLTVEIGAIELASGRAFVGLGTATVAIDRTGKQEWRVGREAGGSPGSPRVANDTHVLTTAVNGTQVEAMLREAATGKPLWSTKYDPGPQNPIGGGPPRGGEPGGPPPGPPDDIRRVEGRLSEGHVVLRDVRSLRVLALADHRQVWQTMSTAPIFTMEVLGGLVIVAADRLSAYPIDAQGNPRWQQELRGARIARTLDGKSIIAATQQTVSAWDLNGVRLWQTPVPARVSEALVDRLTVDAHTAYVTFKPMPPRRDPLEVDVVAVALDAQG